MCCYSLALLRLFLCISFTLCISHSPSYLLIFGLHLVLFAVFALCSYFLVFLLTSLIPTISALASHASSHDIRTHCIVLLLCSFFCLASDNQTSSERSLPFHFGTPKGTPSLSSYRSTDLLCFDSARCTLSPRSLVCFPLFRFLSRSGNTCVPLDHLALVHTHGYTQISSQSYIAQ